MDKTLLKILERLEPSGIGGVNDISDIINDRFQMFEDKTYFDIQRKSLLDFLNFIKGDIVFYKDINEQIITFNQDVKPIKWLNSEMRVTLSNNGLKYLNEYRLTISTIELNGSTLENNRIVSENTTSQSKIFKFQTGVFVFGAIFACFSFIVSCETYIRDGELKQLRLQVSQLKKESMEFQNKFSHIKIPQAQIQKQHDTLYMKMVK